MSLQTILEQVKQATATAAIDIEAAPPQTISGLRGRKRQAEERLKTLKEDYAKEMLRSAVFILTTGAEQAEFSQLAVADFGCLSSEANGFYSDLAGRVPTVLYRNKDATSALFDVLGRHLEDKAMELGVVGYPQLLFKQQYSRHLSTKEDFISLIRQAVNEQVGGEFAGIHVVKSLVDAAILKNHAGKTTPIVLTSEDGATVVDLLSALKRLTPNVFLVAAGKTPKLIKGMAGVIAVKNASKENVELAMTSIKEQLKK